MKSLLSSKKIIILGILFLIIFLWTKGCNTTELISKKSWVVQKQEVENVVLQKGIIATKDSYPVKVGARGIILELVETGVAVKKGDKLLVIDASDAQGKINESELNLEQLKLSYELQEKELEFILFEKDKRIEQDKASLEQFELIQKSELAKPYPNEIRLMEIDEELAQINLENARLELMSRQRLYEKEFLSKSALEPFELRMKTAETYLKETKLKNKILRKGIPEEERVEHKTKVASAKSKLERTITEYKRRIKKKKSQIQSTKQQLELRELQLNRQKDELNSAITYADKDGILVRRKYVNWSAGGVMTEFKPGIERWPQDIVADIIDPASMQVEVAFNEADYRKIKKGMKTIITIPAIPGKEFSGVIKHIGSIAKDRNEVDPTVEQGGISNVMAYNAIVEFDSSVVNLKKGMSAYVKAIIEPRRERLVIPLSFITQRENNEYIINENGEEIEVEGRAVNPIWFEISSGVTEGDTIYKEEVVIK
jgi:multidrug efflux pump subunit AcrA (membrane-fusion protein)